MVRGLVVLAWLSALAGCIDATTFRSPTTVTGLANVTQVAMGRFHTCARKSDGTAWCWGLNETGQLGTQPVLKRYQPAAVQITCP